ncbi:hypothetical protein Bca4012_075912 [Brassica carinata]
MFTIDLLGFFPYAQELTPVRSFKEIEAEFCQNVFNKRTPAYLKRLHRFSTA